MKFWFLVLFSLTFQTIVNSEETRLKDTLTTESRMLKIESSSIYTRLDNNYKDTIKNSEIEEILIPYEVTEITFTNESGYNRISSNSGHYIRGSKFWLLPSDIDGYHEIGVFDIKTHKYETIDGGFLGVFDNNIYFINWRKRSIYYIDNLLHIIPTSHFLSDTILYNTFKNTITYPLFPFNERENVLFMYNENERSFLKFANTNKAIINNYKIQGQICDWSLDGRYVVIFDNMGDRHLIDIKNDLFLGKIPQGSYFISNVQLCTDTYSYDKNIFKIKDGLTRIRIKNLQYNTSKTIGIIIDFDSPEFFQLSENEYFVIDFRGTTYLTGPDSNKYYVLKFKANLE